MQTPRTWERGGLRLRPEFTSECPGGLSSALLLQHTRTFAFTHAQTYTHRERHTEKTPSKVHAAFRQRLSAGARRSPQVRSLPPAGGCGQGAEEESDAGTRAPAPTVIWIYSRCPQESAEKPQVRDIPGCSARRG